MTRARVLIGNHWFRALPPPVSTLSAKLAARLAAPKRRRPPPAARNPDQAVVRRLSGWQRNQWARAGYPAQIGRFAAMVHA